MLLADIQNYEDIGLKSLLIAVIIAMGAVIRYMNNSKEVSPIYSEFKRFARC
jgi:hypothetical protein